MVKVATLPLRLSLIKKSEVKGAKPRKPGKASKIKETFEYGVKNKGGLGPLFNLSKSNLEELNFSMPLIYVIKQERICP